MHSFKDMSVEELTVYFASISPQKAHPAFWTRVDKNLPEGKEVRLFDENGLEAENHWYDWKWEYGAKMAERAYALLRPPGVISNQI